MSAASNPSWCFYVEDACGERFLFTVADRDYEPGFRKHARWWMRYATRPSAQNSTGRHPVKPMRVVAIPSDELA